MNINFFKRIVLVLPLLVGGQSFAQNIVDTYSKECADTFAYLVNKDKTIVRPFKESVIGSTEQLQKFHPVEKDAYQVYRNRKLYNYLTPNKGDRIKITTAQIIHTGSEQVIGFRVEFKLGIRRDDKIWLYYVVNNQATQLLYINIRTQNQKNFWVCDGFVARPAKGDVHLYNLAKNAGPYFDYTTTQFQFNVNELNSAKELPNQILLTGETYRINQMKLRPDYKFLWAHQQHAVTINGKAIGYVVSLNFFKKDQHLEGGGTFLFLNNQGKIITERHWKQ